MSQGQPRRVRKEIRLGKNPDVIYCEEDRIGQGQFGTVYRGRCPASDTVVAVKLLRGLPSIGSMDTASRHRGDRAAEAPQTGKATAPAVKPRPHFPSELELLWALRGDRCPNIVQVLSVWNKPRKHHPPTAATENEKAGQHPQQASSSLPSSPLTSEARERSSSVYVLVTEYCEGGDLQHRLQSLEASVPTHVARSFTYQLCNALYTLKRRRIVHRDIKPANLLLSSRDWEAATLKVADFGMAKAAPPPKMPNKEGRAAAGSTTHATDEDGVGGVLHDEDGEADGTNAVPSTLFYSEMGTPMYMSPERIAGQPYDYKADVYSAGMVLLEMMRGTCVRVTRVSQLRTMVPETVQRLRLRYTAKGEAAPLWLDLVQRMTATDPAQRYAVEDVLRHPWFFASAGPPLPPLTFALPSETLGREAFYGGGADKEAKGDAESETVDGQTATFPTALISAAGAGTDAGAAASNVQDANDAGGSSPLDKPVAAAAGPASPPTPSSPMNAAPPMQTMKVEAEDGTSPSSMPSRISGAEATASTTAAPATGGRRQEPPSHWSLLGVCLGIEPHSNTARCVYTGNSLKAKHAGFAATSATSPALSLPAACGPHVITHAVRGFVDSVYLHVLQDELDPVGGLTIVSFLVELVQNGFGAYLDCLESLGGGAGSTTTTAQQDSATSINGQWLVVRDVSALPEVWQQLMLRLSHAQAAYTAQLPPRMLQNAALWRRRVLKGPTGNLTADDETQAAAHGNGDSRLYDASTSSSEGEATMPGLPNVASITNLSGARPDTNCSRATAAGGAGGSPRLRVYTLTTRAEELIFAKAVDCIQSEALAVLMATPAPSRRRVLPADRREDENVVDATGQDDLLDAMDCLEEEEEQQARLRRSRAVAMTREAPPHHALVPVPSHRGIALLRVLLQRAVLSAAEVGLEAEAAAASRSSPLGSSTPALLPPTTNTSSRHNDSALRTSAFAAVRPTEPSETVASSDYAFVVQVPVYATLKAADVQVVEKLLCAATCAFTNAQRSH